MQKFTCSLAGLVVLATVPAVGMAQDAQSILKMVRDKQIERWEGVETYVLDQSAMGARTQSFFTRAEVKDSDGASHTVFHPNFGNTDPCSGADTSLVDASPEELEQIADAYEMTGDGLATGIEDGLEEAGLPRGLLKATGGDPWATFDPRAMMGGGAAMFRGLADAKRQRAIDDAAPDDSQKQADAFARNAVLAGTEMIDGRKTFHIRGDNLNLVQEADGDSFVIQTINMWIDSEMYVPLKMKMDGVATSRQEKRPMTMESLKLDYRTVPNSKMYESYRQVSKMAGMMTPEQQAEMQQAAKQMAELESQMAQMPAAQRDMIMRQMGPQMDMMKSMASGGGIEMVMETHEIVVNHCDRKQPLTRTTAIGGVEMPPAFSTGVVSGGATPGSATPAHADDAKQRTQQACLQEKMQQAEAANKTKRGVGRLLSVVTRTASRAGNYELARTAGDIYSAGASAEDLSAAAKDLGLTDDDIADCRNP